jgi:hypothetical protein
MRLIRPWLYVGKLAETPNPGLLYSEDIPLTEFLAAVRK